MRRIKRVMIGVSPAFYEALTSHKRELEKRLKFRRPISQPRLTELMMQSGLCFPRVNINLLKNVRKKK